MESYSSKLRKINFDVNRHKHFLKKYYKDSSFYWDNREEFMFLFSVTFPESHWYLESSNITLPSEVIIYLEKRLKTLKQRIREINIKMHKQ